MYMYVFRRFFYNVYFELSREPILFVFCLLSVVSWLLVPLVEQVTGPRAKTINMIRTIVSKAV